MLTVMSIQYDQSLATKMYENGKLIREVADYFELPTSTVRFRLVAAGVTLRPRNGTLLEFTEDQKNLLRDSLAAGRSMAWVAKQLGVSGPVIHRLSKKLGVHTPKPQFQPHAEEMLEMYKARVHIDDIAAKFGTQRAIVYGCIDRLGVNLVDVMKEVYPARTPSERYQAAYQSIVHRRKTDPSFDNSVKLSSKIKRDRIWAKYSQPIMAFFSAGCSTCGSNSSSAVHLDAHHLDTSQKKFLIAHIHMVRPSQEELQLELAKCIPLCANCHRELHAQQGDTYNKGTATSKTALQVAKARIRLAPIFESFRANGCQVCGYSKKSGLSSHHYDPNTKVFNPSQARSLRLSDEITCSELSKCVCLCENCHRKIHAEELECPTPVFKYTAA